ARARDVVPRALALYAAEPLDGLASAWSAVLDLLLRHPRAGSLVELVEASLAQETPKGRDTVASACLAGAIRESRAVVLPDWLGPSVLGVLSHPAARIHIAGQ